MSSLFSNCFASAQNSFEKIKNEAKIEDASIKLYDGLEHSATEEELMDVVAFLQQCIKKNENAPELWAIKYFL